MSWSPKFVKYPSTDQFRSVVSDVLKLQDRNNATEPYTVTFTGTVKLHGTNAAVLWDFNDSHELVCQSRSQFITPQQDNAGFATFISKAETAMEIKRLMRELQPAGSGTIILYGEWCGKGVQAKVAISELPPMFVIFAGLIEPECWISKEQLSLLTPDPKTRIFQIFQFPTWVLDIKFKQPELGIIQNELAKLTTQVEEECPVGRHFGVHGVGEGIVWRGSLNGRSLVFKVKGDKHSVTKVKKMASVDVEKLTSIAEFVEYAATTNRMEQGYTELFGSRVPENEEVGQFIKWVVADIIKEETDTMEAAGITSKDMGKPVSELAKKWFFNKLAQ